MAHPRKTIDKSPLTPMKTPPTPLSKLLPTVVGQTVSVPGGTYIESPETPETPEPPVEPAKPIIDLVNHLANDFKPGLRATFLAEIFTTLPKFTNDAERVIWLRHNMSPALKYLLQLIYGSVSWALPSGAPPYTPYKGRKGSAPTELIQELRRLYVYLDGGAPALPRMKRELMFQAMLEHLDPLESTLVLNIKDRTMTQYLLTRELVECAFPNLLAQPFNVRFIR